MNFMQHVAGKEKFVPATERFGNKWHVTQEKLVLQHVPNLCPRKMSPNMFQKTKVNQITN